MSWFYVENGAPKGPVEDDEFSRLLQAGTVRANTLVWREGMAEWQPHARVLDPAAVLPNDPPPLTAVATVDGARCAECGGTFARRDMVAYNGAFVCAGCRDVFFQKVREGLVMPGGVAIAGEFAGFWIRFAAWLIDNVILWVAGMIVQVPLMMIMGISTTRVNNPGEFPVAFFVVYAISMAASLAITISYGTFFLGRMGATPGKLALGLRVVRSDRSKLTYMRAFGRSWAERLTGLTAIFFCFGYIMAGFDREKRALHDHVCDTRVIKAA